MQSGPARTRSQKDSVMAEPTLNLCPFCGSADVELDEDPTTTCGDTDVFVSCNECQAKGPPCRVGCRDEEEDGPIDLEAEATKFWNERKAAGKRQRP